MTLREVQLAEKYVRERMSEPRGGKWDIRRAPSWRRAGPRAIVPARSWRRIVTFVIAAAAVAGGVSLGMIIATISGVS